VYYRVDVATPQMEYNKGKYNKQLILLYYPNKITEYKRMGQTL